MGSQDLVGSLPSFLPVSAWVWGCWRWPTFVIDKGQRLTPPGEGAQLRCSSSFSAGALGLGWE